MWGRLFLLWTITPALLGNGIVPPDAKYGTVEPKYDYRYCNPDCPCNSLNVIICCCPVQTQSVPALPSSVASGSHEVIILVMSSIVVMCVVLL